MPPVQRPLLLARRAPGRRAGMMPLRAVAAPAAVQAARQRRQIHATARLEDSASASSSSASATPHAGPAPPAGPPTMNWPDFFALRKRQRRLAVLASVPTTALGLSLGVSYFATVEAVPTDLVLGLEPIYAYGIATIGCTLLGYLAGPTIGNAVFRMTVPRNGYTAMQARNADFYDHVRRNRVDPSRQSVNNPVPDWFCEKPGSMSQYRQWLRDQAAYRRKASQHGMLVGKADADSSKDLF